MEILKKKLPKNYKMVVFGDCHLGSPSVNEDTIKELNEFVNSEEHIYVTNIGDNIEAIGPTDKRFAFSKAKYQTAQEQCDGFIELVKPIKKRILAIGLGNHEHTLLNTFNAAKYIAAMLDVSNGMYSYKLEIYNEKNDKLMHKILCHHGFGAITSNAKDRIQAEGNMKATLKNKFNRLGHADVIACYQGHIHRFLIVEPTINNELYLTTKDGKFKQHYRYNERQDAEYISPDARWVCSTGSFMKTYADPGSGFINYSEVAGYAPAEIGYLLQTVEDGEVVKVERVLL
jgi:hypothetical protein